MLKKFIPIILALAIFISACTVNTQPSASDDGEIILSDKLVIYSGRSEPLIQPVLAAFQEKYPDIEVLLKSGSNSQLANALIEEKANPQADVFITTEVFTAHALSQEGVFQSYEPVGYQNLPNAYKAEDASWVGLSHRMRVIMYNKDLVNQDELPKSMFDLTDPKWYGQIAAAGSTNASMQAQIASMIQLVGQDKTEDWLNGLMENNVTFFGGHSDVRKAIGSGEFKLGLVNHYYYYLQLAEGSSVGIIYPDQEIGQMGIISNATTASIINGAKNPGAAKAFLDFLISADGQKIFAENNYEYPLLRGVAYHPNLESVENYTMANVELAQIVNRFDETFDLIDMANLP
ncbi:MAG TPA: extracellular solute-binding protein [Anaerolineaceae bacterium]|nr:extracellular solute-binding protein [Anaerolineaceae bacterium]